MDFSHLRSLLLLLHSCKNTKRLLQTSLPPSNSLHLNHFSLQNLFTQLSWLHFLLPCLACHFQTHPFLLQPRPSCPISPKRSSLHLHSYPPHHSQTKHHHQQTQMAFAPKSTYFCSHSSYSSQQSTLAPLFM